MKNKLKSLSKKLLSLGHISEYKYLDSLIKNSSLEDSKFENIIFWQGAKEKHLDPNSSYSHFSGTEDELVQLIFENLNKAWPSDQKKGTYVVPLPPEKFYSGVVRLDDDSKLVGGYEPHMGNRENRKTWRAESEEKLPADYARAIVGPYWDDLVIYTILAGLIDNKNEDPSSFEEPMTPQTLMYNRYYYKREDELEDDHSSKEFDLLLYKSFNYWRNKAFFSKKK